MMNGKNRCCEKQPIRPSDIAECRSRLGIGQKVRIKVLE